MSILDIFNIKRIKADNKEITEKLAELNRHVIEIGLEDAVLIKRFVDEHKDLLEKLKRDILTKENILTKKVIEIAEKEKTLLVVEEEIMFESFSLYKPKFSFVDSTEYKNRLDICREKQKQLIRDNRAVLADENWQVNGSKAEGKKMVNDMRKLILRSFNNECDFCVDHVKFNNFEKSIERITKAAEQLQKLGRIMGAYVTQEYINFKFDELHLAHEYQVIKEEEKEERKRVRAELREQQKLEQEIRQARERIEKERKHFSKALAELEKMLLKANNKTETLEINNKIEEVKSQFSALDSEENEIDYREKNAKAGYVYVISNIGAFGDNVYKIGMTRRLEPLERVEELGDASVPFSFDTHALIFSDNAPELESKIHSHFDNRRLNKINKRKEFFRASIDEIEQVIRANFDNVFEVKKIAEAEQFRETKLVG
jgi:hypothetical protein